MRPQTTIAPRRSLATFAALRSTARRWWVLLALIFAALCSGYVNVATHGPQFSPYDEWVYFDYLTKFPAQGFVRQGEEIGEQALYAMACHGDGFGPRGEPCTGEDGLYDEPHLYPQQGLTSADPYTPLYFAITWLGAQVASTVSGADLLTAARAVGPLWLAASVIPIVLLLRRWKLPELAQLGVGLLIVSMPMTTFASTYISTDAPMLLAGAAVGWLGTRFAQTGRGGWWLVSVSTFATLFKVTAILAVGLVAVALLLQALTQREQPSVEPRKLVVFALGAGAASLAAEVAWLTFRSLNAVGDSPEQGLSAPLTLRRLASSTVVLLARDFPTAVSPWTMIVAAPLGILAIAGVFGWFLSSRGPGLHRAWSSATAFATVAFPPLLTLAMAYILGEVAPITPRYALSLYPMFAVAIGIVSRNRLGQALVLAYAIGLFGFSIAAAITT